MKSLTITLYMLGAILILPQQVCSTAIEQIEQPDSTQHSNTPPTNQTTSIHEEFPTSELPNTPADIITRLENAVGNYSDYKLKENLRNLEPDHLQFLELAFNALTEGMTNQCCQKGLLDLLADIQHERLNNEFIFAATELTSLVNALDINDDKGAKFTIIEALGSVDSRHLSLVMHANRTFIRRLKLDPNMRIDDIAEIGYLVRAIAQAENAEPNAQKVGALLNFFTDECIAEFGRYGWGTSSIIGSFSGNKTTWEPLFRFLETGLRQLEYTTGNRGKNKSLSDINNDIIERMLETEEEEKKNEERCSQCIIS